MNESILRSTIREELQSLLSEKSFAEPFTKLTKQYTQKFKSLFGMEIEYDGFTWKLDSVNYTGTPYWRKIVNGKPSSKLFTIGAYSRSWLEKQLKK